MSRFFRFFWFLFCLLIFTPAKSQIRPQGSRTDLLEIVSTGSDLIALAEPIAAGTRIMRSVDGGETYTQVFEAAINDSFFALGVNGTEVMAVGTGGIVRKADLSVDPLVWTECNVDGFLGDLLDVLHANGTWMVTGEQTFVSTNGGTDWTKVDENPFGPQRSIVYLGTDTWLTAGGVGVPVIRKGVFNNPGWSWDDKAPQNVFGGIRSLAFDGTNSVLAVGESGIVFLSTDLAENFSVVSQVDVSQNLNAVLSTAANQWVLGGDERLLISLDTTAATPVSTTVLEPVDAQTGNTTWAITEQNGQIVMAGTASVASPSLTGDPSDFTSLTGSVEITLSGTGSLYYTVDGSIPDSMGTLYSSPFDIESSLTLRAVALLDGVYSASVSQAVTAAAPVTLSIDSITTTEVTLSSDSSVIGTNLQLQQSTDLTDPMNWVDVQAPQAGTGAALNWILTPVPSMPTFWRLRISE